MEEVDSETESIDFIMDPTERDQLLPKYEPSMPSCDSDSEIAVTERRSRTRSPSPSRRPSFPAPLDRYNAVYVIFYILGIGSLLPWNFFSTAKEYFVYKLRNTSIPLENATDHDRNLQTMFESYLTVAAMVPNVLFMFLNTAATKLIPLPIRLVVSCVVMIVVFSGTLALTVIDTDSWQHLFFILTIVSIVVMNAASAVFQGGIFGLAGAFPKQYTGSIMGGMGLGGTIAPVAFILATALGSNETSTGFGFFLTAVICCTIALIGYFALPFFPFAVYYIKGPRSIITFNVNSISDSSGIGASSNDPEINCSNEDPLLPSTDSTVQVKDSQQPALWVVFKQIWPYALCVFFVFLVTLSCFPAINSSIVSMTCSHSHCDGAWGAQYFVVVSCFLMFNLSDLMGRTLAGFLPLPGPGSPLLPVFCALRIVFIPLFMLCNVQPRHHHLPVLFKHDAIPIVLMFLFGVSNGHLGTLAMMFGPRKVKLENVEVAGSMMAFFLSLGLAGGSLCSFLLVKLI